MEILLLCYRGCSWENHRGPKHTIQDSSGQLYAHSQFLSNAGFFSLLRVLASVECSKADKPKGYHNYQIGLWKKRFGWVYSKMGKLSWFQLKTIYLTHPWKWWELDLPSNYCAPNDIARTCWEPINIHKHSTERLSIERFSLIDVPQLF